MTDSEATITEIILSVDATEAKAAAYDILMGVTS